MSYINNEWLFIRHIYTPLFDRELGNKENNLKILSWFFCGTIDLSAEGGGGVLYAFQICNVAWLNNR